MITLSCQIKYVCYFGVLFIFSPRVDRLVVLVVEGLEGVDNLSLHLRGQTVCNVSLTLSAGNNFTGMVRKAVPRLRDPASWLALAAGAISRNIRSTFLSIHVFFSFKEFLAILDVIGLIIGRTFHWILQRARRRGLGFPNSVVGQADHGGVDAVHCREEFAVRKWT